MKSDKKRSDGEKVKRKKSDREKLNTEKSGKEKQDSAEATVNGKDGEQSGLEKAAAAEDSSVKADGTAEESSTKKADKTTEACGAEKAGETEEADNTEKADKTTESSEEHSEKDSTAQTESRELDEEDDGDDWEEDDGSPDDWEEESEPSKPWVIVLVFFGMVFAAACICVMLWVFTHPDKQKEENQNVIAGATVAPGSGDDLAPNGMMPSGTGSLPLGNQGDNDASAPNFGETDASGQSILNRVTTQEGRVIIFTDCDDMVTPKEYVNLRTEPSTSQREATVGCRLNQGEIAHRTGISEEMGWSRVEYNDQVLYVITSYVSVVTDTMTTE